MPLLLFNQHYQHRTNQKLRSWANAVFQNRGVCGQAVPSLPFPSPLIPFFCSRPNFLDKLARKHLLCLLCRLVLFHSPRPMGIPHTVLSTFPDNAGDSSFWTVSPGLQMRVWYLPDNRQSYYFCRLDFPTIKFQIFCVVCVTVNMERLLINFGMPL